MIDSNLNKGNAATNTYRLAKGNHDYVQADVAVDSTGDKLTVEIPGDSMVKINIGGASSTADYSVDVSPNDTDYFQDHKTYSGTSIEDQFQLVDRYLTVRVTTASATAGDTATVTVQESR